MVPDALVAVESFPLTINGKLDKGALPDPDFCDEEGYVAPSTETERVICRIWEEVLGLERVGVRSDFFRIGGNSILAIQVSHRMSKALGCDVRVADVFKYKTIAEIISHSLGRTGIDIPKKDTTESALSFAQERLWFIEQYERGTNAYHMPVLLELDKSTDIAGVKYALQQVVSRHEVLRSTIVQGDHQRHGIQIVHEEPLFMEEVVLSNKEDYEPLIKEDVNRPFDLSGAYPLRVKFYRIQSEGTVTEKSGWDKTVLLINMHHIASDGWSMGIFHRELLAYYEAYIKKDTGFSLPALEIQYKDYALWQRSYLTGEVLEKQIRYWKDKLSGYQTLELPTDYARPADTDYRGSSEYFKLNKAVSGRLRALAKDNGVTLHSVMLGSISILLSKYTGQQDIVIGSPIANRQYRQTEGLIGFFVNTQVNRTLLNKSQSYEELIRQVHLGQIEAQRYQDLPFEKLVDELGVERDASRHPVFQVMFGVQRFGTQRNIDAEQNSYFKPFQSEITYEVAKFDLSIFIDDSQEELTGQVSYATSLFGKERIVRFIDHYVHLLDGLTAAPKQPYSQLSVLGAEEYDQIVYGWNETGREYPEDQTVYELFEEQASRTPEGTALVYEGEELSYRELNERSNQLARHIRKAYKARTGESLGADTLIGLYLDRSLEMVIGILGVLKAGGAYVPMDPGYPQERIDYILEDTGAALVLSQRGLSQTTSTELPGEKVICIDLTEALYKEEQTGNLPSTADQQPWPM